MRLIPYRENIIPPMGLTHLNAPMNRLFDEFFGDFTPTHAIWPSFDVFELPEELMVVADLPGIEAKDIKISFAGDTLTIEGERTRKEANYENWFRQERPFGKFTRTIALPLPVDPERVEAIDKAGVLMIKLPKMEGAKTRKIPVKLS